MLELNRRFFGNDGFKGFAKQSPTIFLKNPSTSRLKKLCNSIDDHVKQKKCSRELNHIYTQIIACLVTSASKSKSKNCTHKDFVKEGWKLGKARFSTARKRQKDESFTEVRPLKRRRSEISKSLQKQIVEA